jgi:hypothetical protein
MKEFIAGFILACIVVSPFVLAFHIGRFVQSRKKYNSEFVAKIRRSEKQIERGECTKVDANDIWKSIK